MTRRCVAAGCSNSHKDGYSLYTFPKDLKIRRHWVKFVRMRRAKWPGPSKYSYLCSAHFGPESFSHPPYHRYRSFQINFRNDLKPDAIPTRYSADATDDPVKVDPSSPVFSITSSSIAATPKHTTTPDPVTSVTATPVRSNSNSADVVSLPDHSAIESQAQVSTPVSAGENTPTFGWTSARRRRICKRDLIKSLTLPSFTTTGSSGTDKADTLLLSEIEPERVVEADYEEEQAFRDGQVQTDPPPPPVLVHHKKLQVSTKTVRPPKRSHGTQTMNLSTTTTCTQYETMDCDSCVPVCKETTINHDCYMHSDDSSYGDSSDEEYEDTSSDWTPSEMEEDVDEESLPEEDPVHLKQDIQHEKKFLIFESCLLQLFQYCLLCRSECFVQKVINGTFLRIKQSCPCGYERTWDSQPFIKNLPAGNILLSAAVLFAGATVTKVFKVFRHLGLVSTSVRSFFFHQTKYLQPVVEHVWGQHQSSIVESTRKQQQPISIGGDGRCDSPGHSAKYGCYTIMDLDTNQILETQLVQSNEVTSSNAMEKEGLLRCVKFLFAVGLTISHLITDRHSAITKWIYENLDVNHRFDIWHVAKGLTKKIDAASKLKGCENLKNWQRSIINHMYWVAVSTPSEDSKLMMAKWLSLINHCMDIHTGHGELFPSCSHDLIPNLDKMWIQPSTKEGHKLESLINNPRLVKAISNLSVKHQTYNLEVFHSVLNHFSPKMMGFSYGGMLCRLHLAALHWNENAGRPQVTNQHGEKTYTIVFPKFKKGGYTIAKRVVQGTFSYVDDLMSTLLQMLEGDLTPSVMMGQQTQAPAALCSDFVRPNKDEAVKAHCTRFAK